MEEGNTKENLYEDIPSIPNKVQVTVGENMPLISTHTVESDGHAESNDPLPRSHISQTPPISPPTSSPVIPQATVAASTGETVEPTKIVYDEVEHHPNQGFPAPLQGDEPQYSTVNKFKNAQV